MRAARSQLAIAVLATVVAALGLATVDPTPAAALCAGGAGGANGVDIDQPWGRERTYGSHCLGAPNAYYAGQVNDRVTDGSCVWVEYWEGGFQTWIQQVECTTGGWSSYGWWDQSGDVTALTRLCRDQGCTLYNWNTGY